MSTEAPAIAGAGDAFIVGGRRLRSRLIIGTGKFKDAAETQADPEATACRYSSRLGGRAGRHRCQPWHLPAGPQRPAGTTQGREP